MILFDQVQGIARKSPYSVWRVVSRVLCKFICVQLLPKMQVLSHLSERVLPPVQSHASGNKGEHTMAGPPTRQDLLHRTASTFELFFEPFPLTLLPTGMLSPSTCGLFHSFRS